MARFPKTEPEIAAIAALMTDGIAQAVGDRPVPPVPVVALQAKLDGYMAARAAQVPRMSRSRGVVPQ